MDAQGRVTKKCELVKGNLYRWKKGRKVSDLIVSFEGFDKNGFAIFSDYIGMKFLKHGNTWKKRYQPLNSKVFDEPISL